MKQGLSATRLRVILAATMVLIVIVAVAGFMFVQRNLNEYASAISVLNADANSGDQNLQTLNGLQARLNEERLAIGNAHALVADSDSYDDKAIEDITRIANESGVKITSFEFVEGTTASAPTATAAPPTPGAATAPITPTTAVPAGVIKKTISVSIESPLLYTSLMKFLAGIESNDLEMQIPSVAMTKDKDSKVSTQQFSIEVYVRQ